MQAPANRIQHRAIVEKVNQAVASSMTTYPSFVRLRKL